MHSQRLFHRDLKPENIFLDEFLVPKIGDFGFITSDSYHEKGKIGTEGYIPPEHFEPEQKFKNENFDIWSLGVILFIMVFGRPPFMKAERKCSRFEQILKGKIDVFWNLN